MPLKISAIIITKNEEHRIQGCLDSLEWADEIIVVDSGSTDRTKEICCRYAKVKFYEYQWPGFGIQKNRALDHASGEWIFSIDADERVSTELANEIISTVKSPAYDGYILKRKNFYRGQWIKNCGWWPDKILRLFKKDSGRFNERLVHESIQLAGPIGELNHPIEHCSFNSASDFISKADSYSTLGARQMLQKNKKSGAADAIIHAAATFIKVLVIRRGFMDGRAGLLIAFSNAAGVFYRYIKCAEMQNDSKKL